jgi:hypothetical protein
MQDSPPTNSTKLRDITPLLERIPANGLLII